MRAAIWALQELRTHQKAIVTNILVFLAAFILRALYLVEIKNTPMFSLLIGDALSYDTWAREIAAGNWLGNQVFYQAPLYPYFLGTLYAIFGRNLVLARLIQIFLGSLSCVLLAGAGRIFFSARVGTVAGIIFALYPPVIFSDCLIQKSVLDLLFISMLLYSLGRASRRPRSRAFAWSGIVLGFLILTRENALLLPVIMVAWMLVHYWTKSRNTILSYAGSLLLGLSLVLLPVAVRNKIVGGEFHLTTSQFGPNFYIGNRNGAEGTYVGLIRGREGASYERQDATDLAEKALRRKLSPGEVSSYWAGRAWADIWSEPGRWLRLMTRKWLLTWNRIEVGDTEDQYAYSEYSIILSGLGRLLHLGFLCPLACIGLCLTWSERRRLWILHILLIGYAASVTIFYVFARYRLPMVPLIVLFAAAGLVDGFALLLRRKFKVMLAVGLPALITAVVVNWPLLPRDEGKAATHFNLANALVKQGKIDAAIGHFEEAVRLRPNIAVTHTVLGDALSSLGRFDQAIRHYREAIRIESNSAQNHEGLASALVRSGSLEEGLQQANEAIRIDPSYADPYFTRGLARERSGQQMDAAIADYQTALRLDPGYAEAHYNLGGLLLGQGKPNETVEHMSEAVRLAPRFFPARRKLAEVLATLGRNREALPQIEEVLKNDPNDGEAHFILGRIQAGLGETESAILHYREALKRRPDHVGALNNLAWILATTPEAKYRDGIQAIALASRACEILGNKEAETLDTLAAAYATAGRFRDAHITAIKAIEAASFTGQNDLADTISQRLKMYDEGRPFNENPK